jgi:hypothetical protein
MLASSDEFILILKCFLLLYERSVSGIQSSPFGSNRFPILQIHDNYGLPLT